MTDPSHNATVRLAICQNCDAHLAGPFCAQCGQRAIPTRPTMRELVGDTWDELVGWDGKFLRTVRLLVSRPGELTRAAVEGRRARYVSPVRLYLILSVVYFVVAALTPLPDLPVTVGAGIDVSLTAQRPEDAAFDKAFRQGLASLTPEERALVETEIEAQPAILQSFMRSQVEDFAGMQRRIGEVLPRALFLLVPVLGALLALFYRRRHYPEHLYAAVHLQSFVFLIATFATLARFSHSATAIAAATVVAGAVILGHVMLAQQRIYGESWPKTALKSVAVALLYFVLWGLASTGALIYVGLVRA